MYIMNKTKINDDDLTYIGKEHVEKLNCHMEIYQLHKKTLDKYHKDGYYLESLTLHMKNVTSKTWVTMTTDLAKGVLQYGDYGFGKCDNCEDDGECYSQKDVSGYYVSYLCENCLTEFATAEMRR